MHIFSYYSSASALRCCGADPFLFDVAYAVSRGKREPYLRSPNSHDIHNHQAALTWADRLILITIIN